MPELFNFTIIFLLPFPNQVEPIIQAGHVGMVHHMLLCDCGNGLSTQYLNYSGECYGPNMPPAITRCAGFSAIAAWAIGGKVSCLAYCGY